VTQTVTERRFAKLAAAINRKAGRLGQTARLTTTDLAIVFLDGHGQCYYCHVEVSPGGCSFDHRIPFARGGENRRGNLVLCCVTCQRTKFTKLEEEFAVARQLKVNCAICGRLFVPRWADWQRGYGRTCSRKCSGTKGGEQPKTVAATA
jgi:hypothetical protein